MSERKYPELDGWTICDKLEGIGSFIMLLIGAVFFVLLDRPFILILFFGMEFMFLNVNLKKMRKGLKW